MRKPSENPGNIALDEHVGKAESRLKARSQAPSPDSHLMTAVIPASDHSGRLTVNTVSQAHSKRIVLLNAASLIPHALGPVSYSDICVKRRSIRYYRLFKIVIFEASSHDEKSQMLNIFIYSLNKHLLNIFQVLSPVPNARNTRVMKQVLPSWSSEPMGSWLLIPYSLGRVCSEHLLWILRHPFWEAHKGSKSHLSHTYTQTFILTGKKQFVLWLTSFLKCIWGQVSSVNLYPLTSKW